MTPALASPMIPSSTLLRQDELRDLLHLAAAARSVSLVGVSNMGKSTLLRDLCRPDLAAALGLPATADLRFFYIDCNRMLDQSAHAFYELIARVLLDDLRGEAPDLVRRLRAIYDEMVYPRSDFHIPFNFNQALTTLLEEVSGQMILIFDEFDAVYARLDDRVFLNLRALQDRYPRRLTYITASDRRLSHIRSGEERDEFKELFSHSVHYVCPLTDADVHTYIDQRAAGLAARFDEADVAFLLGQAGGHPTLLEISCRRLAEITGASERSASEDWLIHRAVEDTLRQDLSINDECRKIWQDLDEDEQRTLEAFFQPGARGDAPAVEELKRRGLLVRNAHEPKLFSRLFEDFVLRRRAIQQGIGYGIHINIDAGEALVDGRPTETLTNFEFRLLLLLYGQLNKIVDKYAIVEAVWGEEYIDTVYDSSIEKLVSRLRQKIEPNPAEPRFLLTIRGRGYKLVG